LRLIVVPPTIVHGKESGVCSQYCLDAVRLRGEMPRVHQNRLVFLAADGDGLARLKDAVKTLVAWQSISDDTSRLNLDQHQMRQTSEGILRSQKDVARAVHDTYKWILSPVQDGTARAGDQSVQLEAYDLKTSSSSIADAIKLLVAEESIVITTWSAVHLKTVLKKWFWNETNPAATVSDVWKQMCCRLYLPRLRERRVLEIHAGRGTESTEYFGVADGIEEADGAVRYLNPSFGKRRAIEDSDGVLLIEPGVAASLQKSLDEKQAQQTAAVETAGAAPGVTGAGQVPVSGETLPTRFFGSIELDDLSGLNKLSDVWPNVVSLLGQSKARVKLTLEVSASKPDGFTPDQQRPIRENAKQLGFASSEFGN